MIFAVHTKEEIDQERELFQKMLAYCDQLEQLKVPNDTILELLELRRQMQELSASGMRRLKEVDING